MAQPITCVQTSVQHALRRVSDLKPYLAHSVCLYTWVALGPYYPTNFHFCIEAFDALHGIKTSSLHSFHQKHHVAFFLGIAEF